MVSPLIGVYWLRRQLVLGLGNIRILDASWDLESGSAGARENYNKARISQTTAFFDVDDIADKNSRYDHMLPSPEVFGEKVGKLGIKNTDRVIIYDNSEKYGLFSAPRVWWMFRVFGHKSVAVLDGGLPMWSGCFYPMDETPPTDPTHQQYQATFNPDMVRNMKQVQEHLATGSAQIVDARSDGRFSGRDPEPRPHIPSGHMIGAKNIPFMTCLDPETKLMKSKTELKEVMESSGVDLSQPVVTSCGSGMTAGVVSLAAHMLRIQAPIYDGSWTEWAQAAPESSRTSYVPRNEPTTSKSA